MQCFVYRSPKKAAAYLYLSRQDDFSKVPSGLLKLFGKPELALEFDLTPERKLAVVSAADVIQSLDQQGYYLQMPPENGYPV
jgi:uncharacterized protein